MWSVAIIVLLLLLSFGSKKYINSRQEDELTSLFGSKRFKYIAGTILVCSVTLLSIFGWLAVNESKKRAQLITKAIQDNQNIPMTEQKEKLLQTLIEYQGNETRRDDVAVLGFKF